MTRVKIQNRICLPSDLIASFGISNIFQLLKVVDCDSANLCKYHAANLDLKCCHDQDKSKSVPDVTWRSIHWAVDAF